MSVAECDGFREQFADGRSVGQIADDTDYSASTVRRHVHDRCSHAVEGGDWGSSQVADCPLCGDPVNSRYLPEHLPNCPANGSGANGAADRGGRA